MSLQQTFVLIVSVLYFWFAHFFINRVCTDCNECQGDRTTAEAIIPADTAAVADTPAPKDTTTATANNESGYPIVFNWGSPDGTTFSSFANYKDSIAAELRDDKTLEVYGYYFEKEPPPEGYANMGLARADELIERLAESIPVEKMTPRARLIPEKDGVRDNYFLATTTRWIDAAPSADTAAKEDLMRVDEVEDRALIYFIFNTAKKEMNAEVDTYLDKLAERLKASGETVTLTGHTDDVGSKAANYGLAERRAKVIRDVLRKKGVPRNQIITKSKGETEPTAPNNTDANRRLNRRVEVQVN